MRLSLRIATLLLVAGLCSTALGGVLLEPHRAEPWKVEEWLNADPGRLSSHLGKIVLIDFFQLWCPACNDFSIPLFQEWEEKFGIRDDVLIISIHTVFEGHEVQTPDRLRQFVAEKGITHPVGIDSYRPGAIVPRTMDLYKTGGTPHVAFIDKDGKLVFSHFGRFEPAPVERFITRLLEEKKSRIGKTQSRSMLRPSNRRRTPGTPPRKPPASQPGPEQSADAAAEEETKDEDSQKPDAELSGSYKLRFEPLSVSCGDIGRPIQVITQVTVKGSTIVAKFSRPYAGLRAVTVDYDSGSGDFQAELQQQGTDKGGAKVDVNVQINGRFVTIAEPPEIEYDYYVNKSSEDGSLDCVIEGRGGGARFRAR